MEYTDFGNNQTRNNQRSEANKIWVKKITD